MSLLGDLLKTVGDAMRLSSDVIRYQMESKKQAVKRGVSRIALCIGMGLVALGFVGAGMGLLIYGSYLMVANELGRGPSGMLIGFGCFLVAGLLLLLACRGGGRS